MTRKSHQPGGSGPLTHHEMTTYSKTSGYGTVTARLGSDSQLRFADCCLSQHAAVDPVATPSGHIYSREAIVSYLLSRTKQLKEERAAYDENLKARSLKENNNAEKRQLDLIQTFIHTNSVLQMDTNIHSAALEKSMSKQINSSRDNNLLKRSSYWLAESQPTVDEGTFESLPNPPPDRPPSPMSGQPLKLKDLVSLHLNRETSTSCKEPRVLCAVSGKAITTQPVVAIRFSGCVILQEVYETLIKPSMICPLTGRKIKEQDILILQSGRSGFAATGNVTAKRYRPTLT